MKFYFSLLLLFFIFTGSLPSFGMMPLRKPSIPVLQNPEFIEITVKRKQTVFSIARQYGITMDELYRHNPSAKEGIRFGQTLRIPVRESMQKKETGDTDIPNMENEAVHHDQKHEDSKFFGYKIRFGDTLFELEKKYSMPSDTLLAINPQLQNEMRPGALIRIPAKYLPIIISEAENENEFFRYTVHPDESVYDIASRFNINISELKDANPILDYREPVKEEELLIPDKSLQRKVFDEAIQDSVWILPSYKTKHFYQDARESCGINFESKGKTYQVALLLPLFLNANDTINRLATSRESLADSIFVSAFKKDTYLSKDTLKTKKEKIIDPRSENFMHFYEGVLMAVDSLRKQNKKVELFVFDTGRDSMAVRSIIQQDIFLEMDLIIGPVFPEMQAAISAYSAKNRIPMVSPLSSSGNFEKSNPYYFKVNPDKEYLIRKTSDWVADDFFNANFIVLRMGDYRHLQEAELVDLCRKKLFSTGYYDKHREALFHECNFETEGISGIKSILSQNRKNVFIIPSVNEGQISVAMTNLNTLAEQANVHLVGLSGFKGYRSIQPEYFHRTQLQYLSHYFIDYESILVNRFITAFKKHFSTEPNEFSFQGFDLAYYFMSALHLYGKEMPRCIPHFRIELNQLNLNFQRTSKTGGFMNYGLFRVTHEKDFSIKNKGFYGPGNLFPGQ
ncbi:MAG: LysM peptidoglycan-binding domain-containing protein [Prolixibacteraceae bacterium]|jgi:LysM repeat protein/ABC-type branched-subunit amino acid transport system substrate-binding protein|nr:LysM peptidoglycan-binding domain-containing protein [Prolixibacteraceae bacterium]